MTARRQPIPRPVHTRVVTAPAGSHVLSATCRCDPIPGIDLEDPRRLVYIHRSVQVMPARAGTQSVA